MEGTIKIDAGAQIRDGIKSVNVLGVCHEDQWPYDIAKFTKKPSISCYRDGVKHAAVQYHRVNRDLREFKAAIFERNLVVFGFAVYESLMSSEVAQTGMAPMPSSNEKMLGGHAVAAVGFDDTKNAIIVRNSWGVDWGLKGFFYLPYDYITDGNLSDDFWVVTKIRS